MNETCNLDCRHTYAIAILTRTRYYTVAKRKAVYEYVVSACQLYSSTGDTKWIYRGQKRTFDCIKLMMYRNFQLSMINLRYRVRLLFVSCILPYSASSQNPFCFIVVFFVVLSWLACLLCSRTPGTLASELLYHTSVTLGLVRD